MAYGIDIGTTALKVVSLRRILGRWKATGAARRRLPAAAADEHKKTLLKLTWDVISGLEGGRAGVVGLSGRDINLRIVRQQPMKALQYRTMMKYELEQRKGDATDVYLDYCTLREPDQYFPQYLALIGMGKSQYVDDRIDVLARATVDVRDAVPNPFALYHAHRNAYGTEPGTILLLDIGADNMDIAFVRGGRLIFARNISSGARLFDGNIANQTGGSEAQGERLKLSHGSLGPGGGGDEEGLESQVRAGVRSAAGQLAGFVTSAINHARIELADRELAADKVYVSGGGARLRGFADYLSQSLKVPVEPLDPFRRMDTSSLKGPAGEDFRHLPTDMAVAVGLAQISAASSDASLLSILPDKLRRRRNFFRTTLWLGAGAALLLLALGVATVLAWLRSGAEKTALDDFMKKTSQSSRDIDEMEQLEEEQRQAAAKVDYLLSHTGGGRGLLDTVARLKKVLPKGISLRDLRLVEPPGSSGDRVRVAFTARGRGLVVGDLESQAEDKIKLRNQADPIPLSEILGEVVKWKSSAKAVLVTGEADEVKGGARETLNSLRELLTDPARGVKATLEKQRPSDKPGWRSFEMLVSFE